MKFVREKNKFWFKPEDGEDSYGKIVYSQPQIQGFSEYETLKSIKSIMHFYYSVQGYSQDYKDKWKKVMESYAYDGPALLRLPDALTKVLNASCEDCQKDDSDEVGGLQTYRYNVNVYGDDHYLITKYIEVDTKTGEVEKVFYKLIIQHYTDNYAFTGIGFNYLKHEEMLEFEKCINAFLNYALEVNNKIVNKRNTNFVDSLFIHDSRLYQKNAKGYYEAIYKVGDIVHLHVARNAIYASLDKRKKYETVWSERLTDFNGIPATITEINNKNNSGYIILRYKNNEIRIVSLFEIVYMFRDALDEELCYNIDQIAKDFVDLIGPDDKNFILENSPDEGLAMYAEVLINRTWMCREEHGFSKNCNIETVGPYVQEAFEKATDLIIAE